MNQYSSGKAIQWVSDPLYSRHYHIIGRDFHNGKDSYRYEFREDGVHVHANFFGESKTLGPFKSKPAAGAAATKLYRRMEDAKRD